MKKITSMIAALAMAAGVNAQTHTFDVNTAKVGGAIPKTMYGIFFEDINYAADGGLYGELLINRSFEFPNNYAGWVISGKVSLKDDGPFNKNPHYVRLAPSGHSDKHTMIENQGFFGIGVKANADYRFSVWARVPDGGTSKIWIDLVDNATMTDDQKIGNAGIEISGKEWKKYTVNIKAKKPLAKAHLPEGFNYGGIISQAGGVWKNDPSEPVWKNAPCPMLFFHGTKDQLVPYASSNYGGINFGAFGGGFLKEQFKQNKFPHYSVTVNDADHMIAMLPQSTSLHDMLTFYIRFVQRKQNIVIEATETYFDKAPSMYSR